MKVSSKHPLTTASVVQIISNDAGGQTKYMLPLFNNLPEQTFEQLLLCEKIQEKDRLWAVWRLLPSELRQVALNTTLERSIRRMQGRSGVPEWEQWAERWLSGEDRSQAGAEAASEALMDVDVDEDTEPANRAADQVAWSAELAADSEDSVEVEMAMWNLASLLMDFPYTGEDETGERQHQIQDLLAALEADQG